MGFPNQQGEESQTPAIPTQMLVSGGISMTVMCWIVGVVTTGDGLQKLLECTSVLRLFDSFKLWPTARVKEGRCLVWSRLAIDFAEWAGFHIAICVLLPGFGTTVESSVCER